MTAPHDDAEEDLTVLGVGLFLGAEPDRLDSDRTFEAWLRSYYRYIRDAEWEGWWLELGDRTAELDALVDVQPVPKRRFWSRASPAPAITVTVPVAEVETAADLDTYFVELRHTVWQRVAAKCQWPPPPDRRP
ncbi:hypothetical protein AB0F43_31000 [Kribbella sp. NPDC023972]|uniref:hypothetical protein n=1 Tax=Kribbella sp. NPDC023972 TaxID=3154795 RepID=UPI0033FBA9BF